MIFRLSHPYCWLRPCFRLSLIVGRINSTMIPFSSFSCITFSCSFIGQNHIVGQLSEWLKKNPTPPLQFSNLTLLLVFTCSHLSSNRPVFSTDIRTRRLLFHKKGVSFERLPPTESALFHHSKRAMIQANIWVNSQLPTTTSRDPTDWGWKKDGSGKYKPHWTDLPAAAVTLTEHFKKCGCKGSCSKQRGCTCKRNAMKCISLCPCEYELCNTTALPPN